jgi:hypothetical protein
MEDACVLAEVLCEAGSVESVLHTYSSHCRTRADWVKQECRAHLARNFPPSPKACTARAMNIRRTLPLPFFGRVQQQHFDLLGSFQTRPSSHTFLAKSTIPGQCSFRKFHMRKHCPFCHAPHVNGGAFGPHNKISAVFLPSVSVAVSSASNAKETARPVLPALLAVIVPYVV